MKNNSSVDKIVAQALKGRNQRERDYRAMSLKIHPWICTRCGREFNRHNIRELTVHHKDHDHSNNPSDGSNWEHLCVYCHENEHARFIDSTNESILESSSSKVITNKSLSRLSELVNNKKDKKASE